MHKRNQLRFDILFHKHNTNKSENRPSTMYMTSGFYLTRYYYPFPPVAPVLYHMELSIGGQQFHGKGRTRQAAKHDAAAKAIKSLQKEPLLQQLAEVGH